MRGRVNLLLLAVVLLLSASALEAQLIGQIQFRKVPRPLELGKLPIQFTLAPPGARSLGMGSAFIAIADDATASEANPAGLTILTKPEFSLHLRDYSFDGEIDDAKSAIAFSIANAARGDRGFPEINELASIRTAEDTSSDISFASYVKPYPKWVFSVYYNRFANFETAAVLRDPVTQAAGFNDTDLQDLYTGTTASSIQAESIGISGAFKITDRLAFGASVRMTQLDIAREDEFQIDYFSDLELEGFHFQDYHFTPTTAQFSDILYARQTANGDDNALTYNIGLLWDANQRVSAGLVIKKGGDFEVATTELLFDCISFENVPAADLQKFVVFDGPREGACDLNTLTGDFVSEETTTRGGPTAGDPERITIPDLLGVGFAFRPSERLTLAADVNYITYSDLDPAQFEGVTEPIDDELEFHLGAEYVFLAGSSGNPVTLRAGYFNEPDHDGFAKVDSADDHFTVGTGMVLKSSYQFDVAASFSDRQDVILFSFVYRQ